MDDEIEFKPNQTTIFISMIIFILLVFFLLGKGIYNLGAENMCKETGGKLLINDQGKKRCVNINNLDLCISEEKRILNKPQNQYDLPDIIIGDE